MKYYGIRHKKTKVPLGFTTDHTNVDDSVDVIFSFKERSPSNVWLVKRRVIAENALIKPNRYFYNADYHNPLWNDTMLYNREEYEIFKIEV